MTYSSLLISATSTNSVAEAVSFGVLVLSSEFASAMSVIGNVMLLSTISSSMSMWYVHSRLGRIRRAPCCCHLVR